MESSKLVQVSTKLLRVGIAGVSVLAYLVPAGIDISDFILEKKFVTEASHNLLDFSV